jgi:hypothetical protein
MLSTSKPGHALTNKSSMKGLQRFTQIEMKKHDHSEDFFKCKHMDVCKELNMQWIWYVITQTKWSGCMDYSK